MNFDTVLNYWVLANDWDATILRFRRVHAKADIHLLQIEEKQKKLFPQKLINLILLY